MYLMSLGLLSMSLPGVLSERHSSAGIYSACGSLVSDGASRVSVDCGSRINWNGPADLAAASINGAKLYGIGARAVAVNLRRRCLVIGGPPVDIYTARWPPDAIWRCIDK